MNGGPKAKQDVAWPRQNVPAQEKRNFSKNLNDHEYWRS